jgi:hypothetical protein
VKVQSVVAVKSQSIIVAMAYLLLGLSAYGQAGPDVDNGFKAYGSYDGSSIDSVNLCRA